MSIRLGDSGAALRQIQDAAGAPASAAAAAVDAGSAAIAGPPAPPAGMGLHGPRFSGDTFTATGDAASRGAQTARAAPREPPGIPPRLSIDGAPGANEYQQTTNALQRELARFRSFDSAGMRVPRQEIDEANNLLTIAGGREAFGPMNGAPQADIDALHAARLALQTAVQAHTH